MKWRKRMVVTVVAALMSAAHVTHAAETPSFLKSLEFGEIRFFGPRAAPRGFAFLFSGDDGTDAFDQAAIERLISSGIIVAVINSRVAIGINNSKGKLEQCFDLARPLQRISQRAQKDWNFTRYHQPVLLGRGTGGALVYSALAQAWPYLFAGGISVDLVPTVKLDRKLCGLVTLPLEDGQRLSPQSRLSSDWQVSSTKPPSAEASAFVLDAARANDAATVQAIEPKTLTVLYLNAVEYFLKRETFTTGNTETIASLPIIEVSNDPAENTLVIVYSGDDGWRSVESELVDVLKDEGYAVLGVDISRYLWQEQTPASVAQDLSHIIRYYRAKWSTDRVALVGHAAGANILPYAYSGLSEELQSSVDLISLLSPERAAQFVIGELGRLDNKAVAAIWPLEPEMQLLDSHRIQCIYRRAEASNSLCTAPLLSKAEIIDQSATHPQALDTGILAEFIISRIERGRNEDSR